MKISESWLRTWVNPPVDSDTLAHQLTMAGLEVDDYATVAKPFSGVVVGEVLTVVPHPDADRLRVTTVNIGQAQPLQIVCGAPNVAVGIKVAVATVGARLPGDFNIKKSRLRGVESQGMLCGASEIDLEQSALNDGADGLLILPADAPPGEDLRDYLNLDDRVFDIGITPNRGDCLSIQGIARELGVLHDVPVSGVAIPPVATTTPAQKMVQVHASACPRYAGRVIEGVNPRAQTPFWMREVLTRCGIRCHSIVVDITNYVMLEQGQPLHAFDLASITGDIHVRHALPGEPLTLLNGQDIELTDDVLVISDETKVLALAGIMGGMQSSVSSATTSIFLESAFFDPLAIAGRARRYGLHTDASQRYERGVDVQLAVPALERATQLMIELAGGQAGPVSQVDSQAHLPVRPPISVSLAQIQQLLGYAIESGFVVHTLERLGMSLKGDAQGWQVTPPSWRFDIAIAEDLAEEVARIYGYDRIPVQLPGVEMALKPQQDRMTMQQLRQVMVDLGYQEAISFSFADRKLEQQLNPQGQLLKLANPISSDLDVMRRTVLSSLIPCVQYNVNRQQNRVRLFETGLRFEVQDEPALSGQKVMPGVQQIATLALIATGSHWPEQWHAKPQSLDFYDIKGQIEHVLQACRLRVEYQPSRRVWLHPGQSADILLHGQVIGYLGRLHPSLETALDLAVTWVAEIDLDALLQPYVSHFTELSRFPAVRRDIAILISATISLAQIQHTIQQAAGDLLVASWLFDVYTGNGIEAGQRSLAFALLWQHHQRTLEDAEIKDGMQRVINALQETYKANLRAS